MWGVQTISTITDLKSKYQEPKHKYNKNKETGKLETDEQHYYFVNGYCSIPFRC